MNEISGKRHFTTITPEELKSLAIAINPDVPKEQIEEIDFEAVRKVFINEDSNLEVIYPAELQWWQLNGFDTTGFLVERKFDYFTVVYRV